MKNTQTNAIDITKRYTLGEEIFNSVTHGVGTLLSIAGTAVLIVLAAIHGGSWEVVGAAIFGAALILLYTMSTLYHALTNRHAKSFFRIMDHDTIFFLIAGTYTPITLIPLRGAVGWVLFGVIWGAAALGIAMNSINLEKFRKPSIVCYVLMGWAVIFAIKPMIERCSPMALWFLLIGGLCYSVGIVFYVNKQKRYFHSVWHIFTIAGSIFHYFSVMFMIIQ